MTQQPPIPKRNLNMPPKPPSPLLQKRLQTSRTLLPRPHIRSILNLVTLTSQPRRKLNILSQGSLIETTHRLQNPTPDKLATTPQMNKQTQHFLATQESLTPNRILIRNKLRQHVLMRINRMNPTLNRRNPNIIKILNHIEQSILRNNIVSIKNTHNLPTTKLQPIIQSISLTLRNLTLQKPHIPSPLSKPPTNISSPIHRPIINNNYLKPISRITRTRKSLQKPPNHTLLVLHRQNQREKRQPLPQTIRPLRRTPALTEVPNARGQDRQIIK